MDWLWLKLVGALLATMAVGWTLGRMPGWVKSFVRLRDFIRRNW